MQTISQNGVNLIKKWESLKLQSYPDSKGVWTIGYGHTGRDVKKGQKITEEEAETLLMRDIAIIEKYLNKVIQVELTSNQFEALCSLIFNVGQGNFSKSKMLKLINSNKLSEAANEFYNWDKIVLKGKKVPLRGLTRRRKEEAALFSLPENNLDKRGNKKDDPVAETLNTIDENVDKATKTLDKISMLCSIIKENYKKLVGFLSIACVKIFGILKELLSTPWGLIVGALSLALICYIIIYFKFFRKK